ncbi:MAG: ATPase [Thiohalophilus sp.]|jgi:vacuolar-type H+-ATPase subunit H
MEETLSKLLAAEDKAQAIIDAALKERDRIVNEATADARRAEQQFLARVPEIHQSFVNKAEDRARHTIAEMERRFGERKTQLEQMATKNHDAALEAVLAVVLGQEQD